jgi:hypothetical protein
MRTLMSDDAFEAWLVGFSPEAQEAARRDRARDIEELREQREALHAGGNLTGPAKAAKAAPSSLQTEFGKLQDAAGRILGTKFREFREETMRFLGEQFEAELEKVRADADKAIKSFRATYGKGVRDLCKEYSHLEARDAVRLARQEDRQTLVALERQIETMAHEIERMKQELGR